MEANEPCWIHSPYYGYLQHSPCCSLAHSNWVCKSIRLENISLIILPKWSNDLSSCNKTWVNSVSVGYFVDILGDYFNCSSFEQWSVWDLTPPTSPLSISQPLIRSKFGATRFDRARVSIHRLVSNYASILKISQDTNENDKPQHSN